MLHPFRLNLSVAVCVCLALLTGYGSAQTAPASQNASDAAPGTDVVAQSHAWMTIRDDRDQSTVLLHLPPRGAGGVGGAGKGEGAEWGTVRIAPGVSHPVDAVAAHGNRVWLALQPERSESTHLRRVVTLSAVRSLGGSWEYPPGRPEVCPPLPGQPELLGLVGTSRGPVALLRGRISSEHTEGSLLPVGAIKLLALQAGQWKDVPSPWLGVADAPEIGDGLFLVGTGSSISLVIHPVKGNAPVVWRATLPDRLDEPGTGGEAVRWARDEVSTGVLTAGWWPDSVMFVGDERTGQIVALRSTANQEVELVAYRPGGAVRIAAVPGIPRVHRVAPLHGTGSIAFLWWESAAKEKPQNSPAAPGSTSAREFRIAEVSATSGRVLYEGPTVGGGVFSAREFQTLAVALLLITAAVLLFALRSDSSPIVKLPPDFAPAAALPRLLAALADLAPGILLASLAMDVSIESMFNPLAMLGSDARPMVWPVALLFTIIHCSIGEWITGRTLGKSLVGLQVAAIRTDPETGEPRLAPLRLWQAVIRNVFRWCIPAIGMLLLVDAARRYPPDMLARTIVLAPVPEEPEDED